MIHLLLAKLAMQVKLTNIFSAFDGLTNAMQKYFKTQFDFKKSIELY